MKIVKFTNAENNKPLYLNIDHIVSFAESVEDNRKTYIKVIGDYYLVNENIDDVLFLVSE
jgi:uncharacterized protein YlzI (FlbEa/FlbD family)